MSGSPAVASVMEGPPGYDLAVLALSAEKAGAGPDQVSRLVASYQKAASETHPDAGEVTRRSIIAREATDAAGLARMRALRLAAEVLYFTSRLRRPASTSADTGGDLAGLARARMALRNLD